MVNNMKLNNFDKNILINLIQRELEYYENKEDIYDEDIKYIKSLYKMINQLLEGNE